MGSISKKTSISELVALRNQRLTYQEIADLIGISVSSVANRMVGVDPFKGMKMCRAEKRTLELMKMYEQGLSDRDMMISTGLALTTIWAWRHRHRLPENKSYRDRKKDLLFSLLWEQGLNDNQISKRSGYAVSTVRLWREKKGVPTNGKNIDTRKNRRENKKEGTLCGVEGLIT